MCMHAGSCNASVSSSAENRRSYARAPEPQRAKYVPKLAEIRPASNRMSSIPLPVGTGRGYTPRRRVVRRSTPRKDRLMVALAAVKWCTETTTGAQ